MSFKYGSFLIKFLMYTSFLSGCQSLNPFDNSSQEDTKPAWPVGAVNLDAQQTPHIQTVPAAYATWHAGPERNKQIVCIAPEASQGSEAWRRFEWCMAYFNGLLSQQAYQTGLVEQLEALTEPITESTENSE